MSATGHRDTERLTELLADEACGSLEPAEQQELATLLTQGIRQPGRDELMGTAALVQVSLLRADPPAARRMPGALRHRLAAQGEHFIACHGGALTVTDLSDARDRLRPAMAGGPAAAGPPGSLSPAITLAAAAAGPATSPVRRWISGATAGWSLAAMLAVAFVAYRVEGPRLEDPGTPLPVASASSTPAALRAALLASAGDAVTLPWQPPTQAGYAGVTGDVVWSQRRQAGYLRLVGLPVNDRMKAQYQLWIVDPERDTHPVDGGVFDVTATGEIIVPIQAKLPVIAPTAFAITLEQPGGVVVSTRPLLVIAAS